MSLNKSSTYEGIEKLIDGKVFTIRFNVPKKKNAITATMYIGFLAYLEEAIADNSVSVVVVTGNGEFFSSGNDFGYMMNPSDLSSENIDVSERVKLFENFVTAIIDFPKPMIGVLNGPAVGIAVTVLALMDAVYSIDTAWLHTPFTQLGLCPEGCSSYTFPRIMGATKASEMLMFSKKVTATEACRLGLVTEVFPKAEFDAAMKLKMKTISELPPTAMMNAKKLCRRNEREILHRVHEEESKLLASLLSSEETFHAMMKSFNRKKSKL